VQSPSYAVAMAAAGLSTPAYSYALNNPIYYADPTGLNLKWKQLCVKLAKSIGNLKTEIAEREADLLKGGLPEACAGDESAPRKSMRGHRRLLEKVKGYLKNAKEEYADKCGGGPPGAIATASSFAFPPQATETGPALTPMTVTLSGIVVFVAYVAASAATGF